MVLKKRIVNGFTLIELLVVIGVLLVVLAITLIAINPTEQFGKTNDVVATAISNDFVKSNNEYFTREKSYPWEKDLNCRNEIEEGRSIYEMPSCITQITKGGQIDNEYKKNPSTKEIYGKKCGEKVVICYQPKSKKIYTDAKYNKFGVTEPGCPGSKGSGKDCYWCKPVNNKGMCDGDPTPTSSYSPTPTLTPTNIPSPTTVPTSTPTPSNTPSPTLTPTPTPSNPWGNAAVFHGKVGGLNPPTYTWINQFMEVTYDPKLNLTTNNVTVEAWIKPDIPTGLGYDYAIAQNEFTLTMDARQNGPDISYRYYFDVLSATNGCGRTVVYSDTYNWYPWSLTGPPGPVSKTVTPSDFIKWKHIAGVMQNGNLNIYENGIKLATYNIGMTVCKRDLSLLVGARDNGPLFGAPWYYNFFQGAIDEVRISDIARYTNNFVPQKLPFTPDQNTKMLYHFNSNTQDSSANSLNGNLVGGVTYINSDIPTD